MSRGDCWVVLDPGHGGERDLGRSSPHGASGRHGLLEKDIVLDLARRVAPRLRARVRFTRTRDVNVSLEDRRALTRRLGAAVLVSLHANHGPPAARGAEIYVHRAHASSQTGSAALARELHRALDRAPHPCHVCAPMAADLALLEPGGLGQRTAACLVEVDYLSHQEGERRLASELGREAIACAIAEAVNGYLARHSEPRAQATASEQEEARRADFIHGLAARPSKPSPSGPGSAPVSARPW